MKRYVLFLTTILLLIVTQAFAQPVCVYEWCDAPWPPPSGVDRTIGKDNCKLACTKIAKTSATSYRVFHSSGDTLYHTDLPADDVTISGEYVVLKFQGKVVAQFLRSNVSGWKQL